MSGPNLVFAVIGRGALLRSCVETLIARRLAVAVVVSPDADMAQICAARDIRHGSELRLLASELSPGTRGVLLSVSNDRLIPAAILDAFDLAVNFHDGPLPEYSGSHVTSWALMARERSHAITWHCMTSRADAGDILLRVPVPIVADETALSLNGKCHQAALASFPMLLDSIVQGSLSRRPQNLKLRNFFARDRRPERCAVIDCSAQAADIDALVRALACGMFANRLGVPKLWLGAGFVTVGRSRVRAARSRKPPGTILRVDDDGLEVATASHDLVLGDFATLDGRPLAIVELRATYRLVEGGILSVDDPRISRSLDEAAGCQLRQEEAWVRHFAELQPLALPMLPHPDAEGGGVTVRTAACAEERMLAIVAAGLASLAGTTRYDVGLRAGAKGELVADVRPFRVDAPAAAGFDAFEQPVAEALAGWRAQGIYLRDAPTRYPEVRLPAGWSSFDAWPVIIELAQPGPDAPMATLHISFDAAAGLLTVATPRGGLAPRALDAIGRELEGVAKGFAGRA